MVLFAQNINKMYKSGKTEFQALTNITLDIKKGEIVVILGPSGSGKSTLLNAIGGIDLIDEGEILVEDLSLTKMNSKQLVSYRRNVVGFVFQMYNLIPNLTVYENIELAANISETPLSVKDMIKAVGLEGMDNRFPREISGGQQQRVSIARAIVKNPRLLLCDEPTGALDSTTSKDILSLIKKINETYNTTILIITHNQAISQMADRVITLKDGRIESDHVQTKKLAPEGIEW
ncbi:MAG TPA: ABC transporter ATP-binding protein [Candidatus Angelobacter sp.]|nr:ABC transporter ATP-binding protein [Candidatus Angelobacter sp.]